MELPISTVIILVLMIIVVVALVAFLMGVWTPFKSGYNAEQAKQDGCKNYILQGGCKNEGKADDITVDYPEKDDTLRDMCKKIYVTTNCSIVCGC